MDKAPLQPRTVAVVGSGMAGLVTAHLLHQDTQRRFRVTLLEKVNQAPPVSRQLRGVQVLVRVGSPAARDFLESLARGPADAILTEAAITALGSLRE